MYLPVKEPWNIYNGRADCENRIRELKEDYGLASFCLQDFWVCEASFRWAMVVCNPLMLFQHMALSNGGKKWMLQTLGSQCFAIGAWTVNHARKTVLKISLTKKKRLRMDQIRDRIQELTAPFLISTG